MWWDPGPPVNFPICLWLRLSPCLQRSQKTKKKKKKGSPLIITRGNEARAGRRAAGHGAELISCGVPGRRDGRRCAQMKLAISGWGKLGLLQTQANKLRALEGKAGAERHDVLSSSLPTAPTAPRHEGARRAACLGPVGASPPGGKYSWQKYACRPEGWVPLCFFHRHLWADFC